MGPVLAGEQSVRPRAGDLVVYALCYSVDYSDLIGTVLKVEGDRATVMWTDPDGNPDIEVHTCACLHVVADELEAQRIRRDRCRGVD